MNKKVFLIFFVCTLALLSICNVCFAQEAGYRVQPTDVLKIEVHEHEDLTCKTRVTNDGYITFPLLSKVYVYDMTVQEIESKIKKLLEADYLVTAQVLVFIDEYHPRQISVIGEVNNPGKYDMPQEKDMTLLEGIALSGGFTEDADINNTTVIRMINGERQLVKIRVRDITEKGRKEEDIVLKADDIVFIPESFF